MKLIKPVMVGALLLLSIVSNAGLPEMMKIYHNPNLAPKAKQCKGNQDCNAFMALSKHWNEIPNNYRYQGEFDIKSYAKKGKTWDNQGRNIGLHKGFYLYTDKAIQYQEAGFENLSEPYIERGFAVLLYIEDKNHWIQD